MTRNSTRQLLGILAGLVLAGCGEDEGGTGGAGGTGGGASSSAVSASSASTGGSGGSGGEPEPLPPNSCECLAGFSVGGDDPDGPGAACANCFTDEFSSGCYDLGQACFAIPECKAIFECLKLAAYAPAEIPGCLPPTLSTDPADEAFYAAVGCLCPLCESACVYPEKIACEIAEDPPHCACILGAAAASECSSCVDAAEAGACSAEKAACDATRGCGHILECMDECAGAAADGPCVEACFGSAGAPREAAEAFYGCACQGCAACDPSPRCP